MTAKRMGLMGILALAVLASACGDGGSQESADEYPSDDITMVVPFPPGTTIDSQGRTVAQYYQQEFGQTVVVENVGGASGAVGTAEVVNSEPDGYTIGMSTISTLAQPALTEDIGYEIDDFAAIGVTTEQAGILAVRADSEYETAEQFFEAAEENPGEARVAQSGATTPQGIELERLSDIYGVEVNSIPFDGSPAAINAVAGGNVEAVFTPGDPIVSRIEGGELRALAVGSEERVPYLPDTPTLVELGYEDLTASTSTIGLIAPQDAPPEIVEKLETTLEEALQDPEVREQVGERYIPEEFIDAEGYADLVDVQYEAYEQFVE